MKGHIIQPPSMKKSKKFVNKFSSRYFNIQVEKSYSLLLNEYSPDKEEKSHKE